MNTEKSPFNISRLLDVEMDVTVRFGLTEMPLQDIVNFGNGSMIELNRTVDDPVELLVNNFPFARGEVVVVDGYYSIKITELDLPGNDSSNPFSNAQAENLKPQEKPVQQAEKPLNTPPQQQQQQNPANNPQPPQNKPPQNNPAPPKQNDAPANKQ